MTLDQWASRWGIPAQAMNELRQIFAAPCQVDPQGQSMSEAAVSQRVRLAAPRGEAILWRNNVGALTDDRGVPVRYGLANDSAKINKNLKSSDLIGITPVVVSGRRLGVFTAIETKQAGWVYRGTPREEAQLRYINLVQSFGGIAGFAQSPEDYAAIIRRYTDAL